MVLSDLFLNIVGADFERHFGGWLSSKLLLDSFEGNGRTILESELGGAERFREGNFRGVGAGSVLRRFVTDLQRHAVFVVLENRPAGVFAV